MKTSLSCLAAIAALTLPLMGENFSFAFEGSPEQRERLEKLQGSSDPPKWDLDDWENSEELTLENTKGKIVVLDFWATWCGPCLAAIPKTNKLMQKYQNDVIIIGVCHPRGSEKMEEVVESKGIKFPVAIDDRGRTAERYEVNGYPDYFVFDRDGTLVVADCSNSQVEAVIKKLLKQ
ncbi:MAG: redoxin domain-containing protein [Verrucomicrobiota bacterium]